jgi:hypothetical protein
MRIIELDDSKKSQQTLDSRNKLKGFGDAAE